MAKLHGLSAPELTRLIRQRAVSSVEVVEAHIRRIEDVNPLLNALVVPRFERAMDEARLADSHGSKCQWHGPLHGLPVTVKESFDLIGTPSSAGVHRWSRRPVCSDSTIVAQLKEAGAIVLGKTNLSQVLWFNESDNPVYGRTNNPWSYAHTSGGSSGGEAALIAASGSPLGFGTDNGGSLRHPAHCCGVCSLKPTSGRLSTAGTADDRIYPRNEGICNQPGPVAREVESLALAMHVFANQPTQAIGSGQSSLRRLTQAQDVPALRVGYFTDDGVCTASPAIATAVLQAVSVLVDSGAHVEEFEPPDPRAAFELYEALVTSDILTTVGAFLGDSPRDPRVDDGLSELRLIQEDGSGAADTYRTHVASQRAYKAAFIEALDSRRFDAIVCPVDARPAFEHGTSRALSASQSYSTLFNVIGLPAGVVCAAYTQADESHQTPLPVGVQVAARHWSEDVVLAIMEHIEQALALGAPHALDANDKRRLLAPIPT